ncbi:sugar kinase [Streptomyces uncialis]|uniref:sugar kinase n=1 Tax=Streptomyces uncialis TaxID=1048205 RepID=UPI0038047C97
MQSVPHQAPPPDEEPRPEARGRMIRRRALTLLIIGLLIGVPAGYLVISANQSRDSGRDKAAKYSATGLTEGWPSRVQRRVYDVSIPPYSSDVAHYETNNWKTSRLYVQFLTSNEGLDRFLGELGFSSDALRRDDLTIGVRDRGVVGWDFTGDGPWWGLSREQKDPMPSQDVVVNWSNPDHPMVYMVSATTP